MKKPKRLFKRDRVDAIIELTRTPISTEQIAGSMFMDMQSARRYVKHMVESEALIADHKIRKRIFYKSTGKYNPPIATADYFTRDISVRRPIVTDAVAFRDEWTELFFGPYNKETPSH